MIQRLSIAPGLLRSLALLCLILPLLGGCVSEITRMRAEVNDLKQDSFESKKELAAIKQTLKSLGKDVSVTMDKARGLPQEESLSALRDSQTSLYTQVSDILREMQTLSGRFEENKFFVEKELKRNSSEMEVVKSKFDSLSGTAGSGDPEQLKRIRDRLDSMEADIALLKAKLAAIGTLKGQASGNTPATPEYIYDKAYGEFEAGNYTEARKRMQDFLKRYPDNELAGNAQFWVGETYYNEKAFDDAVLAYEDVIQRYGDSRKVPAAMLKQAYAFLMLGDKKAAEGILKELIKKYPDSEMADKAKTKLKSIN